MISLVSLVSWLLFLHNYAFVFDISCISLPLLAAQSILSPELSVNAGQDCLFSTNTTKCADISNDM